MTHFIYLILVLLNYEIKTIDFLMIWSILFLLHASSTQINNFTDISGLIGEPSLCYCGSQAWLPSWYQS